MCVLLTDNKSHLYNQNIFSEKEIMVKKIILVFLITGLLIACDTGSSGGSSGNKKSEDKYWGYAKEGDLSLAIKHSDPYDYSVMLSRKGTVTITIEGATLRDGTNECTIVFDDSITSWDFDDEWAFWGDQYEFKVNNYKIWEYTVNAVGVADDDSTRVEFEKKQKVKFQDPYDTIYQPANATYEYLEIPEWGTAVCDGYWDEDFKYPRKYYKMKAGTSGVLHLDIIKKGSGTYTIQRYDTEKARFVPIYNENHIEAETAFYLYLNQGNTYTEAQSYYEYHVWIEED